MIFFYLLTFSLTVFSLIALYNYFTAPELRSDKLSPADPELISVLIPARNEEQNINNCIESILAQDYPLKEIIVLDDSSTDRTFERASAFNNRGIKVIKGKELPGKWIGKNWACHQLALEAKSNYLLFIDADVLLKRSAISSAFNDLKRSEAALLSVFPTQIINSIGEYLIVPLMNWLLLNFLPLKFVYSTPFRSFVAANGQFMLWNKNEYFKAGGHLKVFNKVVEDMELARMLKAKGIKIKTLLGSNLVYCKMYNSFKSAFNGYQKNFYPGFNMLPIFFLLVIMFLLVVFVSPYFLLGNDPILMLPLLLVLMSRLLIAFKSSQSWLAAIILHPFQMVLMFVIGIISVIKTGFHSLEWKERKI